MTQLITIIEALALIALYWGSPIAAVAIAAAIYKRSKRRYHVGNPKVAVPVQTFRTKGAAIQASLELHRQHGRAFRITSTR